MSKMDNLRAMREARFDAAQKAAQKAAPKTAAKAAPAAAPTAAASKTAAVAAATSAVDAGESLCGHQSMNGRRCTREHGHAAKSHRYS
jgi:hypothetical protein